MKNKAVRLFYKTIFKPIFFLIDPEAVHDYITLAGRLLGSNFLTRNLTAALFNFSDEILEQEILGIKFTNPVGLAAGFDKNARLTQILPSAGFGYTEIGTITGEGCIGNNKPRLWRLPRSKGLVVNYGLKNDGCEKIAARLKNQNFIIPVITSIGKTNCKETVNMDAGIKDYVKAYKEFAEIGQISDINISCPNAFGGTPFSDPKKLDKLLTQIDNVSTKKPVFLKMPADLKESELDEILKVVKKHKVSGFICSNLTKIRNSKILDAYIPQKGGLSGKIVEDLANQQIQMIHQKTNGKYVIIGCGGVFSAEDAYKKIRAGASLVQLITGMIFEGPQLISEINQELVRLLKQDGYKNISQAVGSSRNIV